MRPLPESDRVRVGPYRLLAELGQGGMGRVFLAAGPDGRAVAVKLVREQFAGDPGFRERFRREVDASRRVYGGYTAAVINAGPDAPTPWLASVYVPGPSLREAVEAAGPLPEQAVLRLAAGLAAALEEVHAAGLVHRDLKPANVLLAEDGPRVIDFGIARAGDSPGGELTGAGYVVGAPAYMSPEHARGENATAASDVFSLGCVLAMAATGTDLFGADSAPQVLYRVVHTVPDLSALPARLRDVIAPCLARDPADRPTPAGVRDLVGTLEPWARPWPDAVHRLIAAQRSELTALLEGADSAKTVTTPVLGPGTTQLAPVLRPAGGPPTLRGTAAVPVPSAPAETAEHLPVAPPHANRTRLVFWLCAGATVVVLLVVLGFVVTPVLLRGLRAPAGGGTRAGSSTSTSPSPSPTSASPTGPPTGEVHGVGGKCLDVQNGRTDDRTLVQLWACNGGDNQKWTIDSDGTVQYQDRCLDVADAGTENGTKVQIYGCNGTGAQQWTVRGTMLVNAPSGRCLDDPLNSPDGTQLQIWDCLNGPNQQWQLPS